jgi:RNA recognition motif-containing protein
MTKRGNVIQLEISAIDSPGQVSSDINDRNAVKKSRMDADELANTLHVTNLDFDLTANDIYQFARRFGNYHCTLGLNHRNESKGFAMLTFQYRDDAESFMNVDLSINGRQVMVRWATQREADGFPWPPQAPRGFGITYRRFRIPAAWPISPCAEAFQGDLTPDDALIPERAKSPSPPPPPPPGSKRFEKRLPPPRAPPPGADPFDEMVDRIRTEGLEAFSIGELQQMLKMREQGDGKFATIAAFIVDKGKRGDNGPYRRDER